MRALRDLQHTLETLHDVSAGIDVLDYLIDDGGRRDIPGAHEGLPEQLFVREQDDAMELALYIDPRILANLERDDPMRVLHAGNLEPWCVALEGVSHFVFVAWRANAGWPVTALEMEIQAEVDKFVVAWLLLARQRGAAAGMGQFLVRQLFESYVLREGLQPDEIDRYHTSSRVAAGFCRDLARRYDAVKQARDIQRAARAFYRQGLVGKLRPAA